MRASSRIWSSMTNIQPIINIHLTNIQPTNSASPADDQLLVSNEITCLIQKSNGHARQAEILDQPSQLEHRPYGRAKNDLVQGYTQLITDRVDDGWTWHLVTFLFAQFPGPRLAVMNRIKTRCDRRMHARTSFERQIPDEHEASPDCLNFPKSDVPKGVPELVFGP
jgi:hypothetical protein